MRLLNIFLLFTTLFVDKLTNGNKINEDKTNFTVALKQNNVYILKQLLNNVSNPKSVLYGNYINDPTIFKNILSPAQDEMTKVYNWFNNYNITIYNDYGDSLYCGGYISDIEKMFNVKLYNLNLRKKALYRSKTDYIIPEYLQDIIVFVEGISNRIYNRYKINRVLSNNSR